MFTSQISLYRIISSLPALALAFVLSGCVSVPQVIKGVGEPQQNLSQIMVAPQQYIGQQARLGGKVTAVENQQDSTRLEIAVMSLDSGARPVPGSVSVGRIYANVQGFLDPVDYRGHLITVLGTISGTEQGLIGHKQYQFLLLDVTGYQRWRVLQQMTPPEYINPWFWGGPYWNYGFTPWGWRSSFPSNIEMVVEE